MSLLRALELVSVIPVDARFNTEQVRGAPHWFAYWRRNGKRVRKYLGTAHNRDRHELAIAVVRAELARLERDAAATPAGARLEAFRARLNLAGDEQTTVAVMIVDPQPQAGGQG